MPIGSPELDKFNGGWLWSLFACNAERAKIATEYSADLSGAVSASVSAATTELGSAASMIGSGVMSYYGSKAASGFLTTIAY